MAGLYRYGGCNQYLRRYHRPPLLVPVFFVAPVYLWLVAEGLELAVRPAPQRSLPLLHKHLSEVKRAPTLNNVNICSSKSRYISIIVCCWRSVWRVPTTNSRKSQLGFKKKTPYTRLFFTHVILFDAPFRILVPHSSISSYYTNLPTDNSCSCFVPVPPERSSHLTPSGPTALRGRDDT